MSYCTVIYNEALPLCIIAQLYKRSTTLVADSGYYVVLRNGVTTRMHTIIHAAVTRAMVDQHAEVDTYTHKERHKCIILSW